MKIFFKTIQILFITLFVYVANAQNRRLKYPDDFTELNVETLSEKYWFQKYTINRYRIESDCGIIVLDEVPNSRFQRAWLVDSDFGIFIGVNSGEWSGGFYKKSKQGAPILIKDINVKFLHKNLNDDVLLFNVDNIKKSCSLEIVYTDDLDQTTKTKVLSTVNDIPTSIFYDSIGTLYFTGANNLYRYESGEIHSLLPVGLWKNINIENTVQQSDSIILLGIQGGLLEFNFKTKKLRLFVVKRN